MQAKPPSSLSPLTLEVLAIMATGKRVNSDDDDGSGGIGGDNGGGGGGGGGGGRYADSGDGSTDGSDVEYIDSSTLVPGSIGGGVAAMLVPVPASVPASVQTVRVMRTNMMPALW